MNWLRLVLKSRSLTDISFQCRRDPQTALHSHVKLFSFTEICRLAQDPRAINKPELTVERGKKQNKTKTKKQTGGNLMNSLNIPTEVLKDMNILKFNQNKADQATQDYL